MCVCVLPVTSTALFFTDSSSDRLLVTQTRTELQPSRRSWWTTGGTIQNREATNAAAHISDAQPRLSVRAETQAKSSQAATQRPVAASICTLLRFPRCSTQPFWPTALQACPQTCSSTGSARRARGPHPSS